MIFHINVLGCYKQLFCVTPDGPCTMENKKSPVPWKYIEGIKNDFREEQFEPDTNKYYHCADFVAFELCSEEVEL